MDPNAALAEIRLDTAALHGEITSAFVEPRPLDLRDAADDLEHAASSLLEWADRGGFPPDDAHWHAALVVAHLTVANARQRADALDPATP